MTTVTRECIFFVRNQKRSKEEEEEEEEGESLERSMWSVPKK